MQQIYRKTPTPKCDFNKVALQLYWNRTSAFFKVYRELRILARMLALRKKFILHILYLYLHFSGPHSLVFRLNTEITP